jgi:lipopolysaccharide export system permease protein
LIFYGFLTILSWVDILRLEFSKSISSVNLFYLALLKTPIIIHPLIPIITIITSLSFFINISRNSELVIIRSAGRSILRSMFAPIITIFTLGLIMVLIVNPFNTIAFKLYNSELSKINKSLSSYSINNEGIWLREGHIDGQRVIHAKTVRNNGKQLKQVTIFEFNKFSIPTTRINAQLAIVDNKQWNLKDGKIWKVNRDDRPEDRAKSFKNLQLKTELNLEKIRLGFGEPSKISIWELKNYIKRIEHAGFSSLKHRVFLHTEIALPFFMVGMFLIGGALNMGHTRVSKKGLAILISIIMGISAFLLNNLTEILSQNGAIPFLLGAWAPPVIVIFISLGLILHLEDG